MNDDILSLLPKLGTMGSNEGRTKVTGTSTHSSSVIDAMTEGNEISLVGFGNFGINKIAARRGRNPRTGLALDIPAYNQPRFKVGKKLKDVCNK